MTLGSSSELLVLHSVRLLGFAEVEAIAHHAGARLAEVLRVLDEAQREGWVQHSEFAGLGGWFLTDLGRAENQRQLADERAKADPDEEVARIYCAFLPLNARLLRAVTDWQSISTDDDRLVPNDHSDQEWDTRVLDELTSIGRLFVPLNEGLSSVLSRFDGYSARFESALKKAKSGEHVWIDTTSVDLCHKVWFQLHEDLVATLGVDRSAEHPAGDIRDGRGG